MKFQRPEFAIALLVFVLIYFFRWKLRSFVSHSLVHRVKSLSVHTSRWVYLPSCLEALATVSILLALLDPVLLLTQVRVATRGLNVVMLVDLSSSMMEYMNQESQQLPRAFGIPRQTKLEAVKEAIRNFVRGRNGDRVGTVVFSERPYVVNPLTLDYSYVCDYLNLVDSKTLTGEGRTAIGEAIFAGLRLLRWRDPEKQSKGAIIIFTDGENNSGRTIYEALAKAHQEMVPVYLIGLQIWDLADRDQLKNALTSTGGRLFDVQDEEQLKEAYQSIDSLERQELYTDRYVRNSPFYHPFVAGTLGLLLCTCFLRIFPYFIEAG